MKKLIKENVESIYSHWYVWLFPIFALIISGFLFFKYFFDHGPTIAITFDEVSVIQPEKTRIRFRGIEIGVVKNLAVSDDRKNVVVYAVLKKGLDDFAVEGAKFWIVTPKVSLQGLTGLDTIFSGPYIEALPGKADAQTQT
jgi:paraquat-inducible protein B